MTLAQGARIIGVDSTRFSRMETGSYRLTADQVERLLKEYGRADDVTVRALRQAAESSLVRGWWDAFEDVIHPKLRDFIALEAEATTIKSHHGVLVPGLFQTPEYVRDMMGFSQEDMTTPRIEAVTSVRLSRKSVLTRTNAPQVQAIIPEVALCRTTDNPIVMRHQVRYLLDCAMLPNVHLMLMPLRAANVPALNANFSVMEFAPPWPRCAYMEHDRGGEFLEEADDVRGVTSQFQRLTEHAWDPDKTVRYFHDYLEGAPHEEPHQSR